MKPYGKILGLFLLILITASISAQDSNCNIRRSFDAKTSSNLRLSNKYGNINIITGSVDSILICATITIIQDNLSLVKKGIKLININMEKLSDTVTIATLFDKKFFSEESRLGRKSFSVDYFITMPDKLNLDITDEFGNVSLDDISGSLKLKLSQGILSAKKILRGNTDPVNSINVDHGKITIDELNWMNITIQNCPSVNIEKARALNMTSVISKINIGEINSLVVNSKSDSYNINAINNILSESIYSGFALGTLTGKLKSKVSYGALKISNLVKDFSTVDIMSDQALITLNLQKGLQFKSDILGNNSQIEFPADKYPGVIKSVVGQYSTIVGLAGTDKETRSTLKIRATGGKVTIQ